MTPTLGRALIKTCLFLMPIFASAAPSWALVAQSDTATWEAKAHSFDVIEKSGLFTYKMVVRFHRKSQQTYQFYVVAITRDDCQAEMGKVVFFDTKGNVSNTADYVKDGGTVGSILGATLCQVSEEYYK